LPPRRCCFRGKNGSPAHLIDRYQQTVPMDQKPAMHSGFQRRTEMQHLGRLGPMAACARTPSRIRKGFPQSPQMMCQGLSRGVLHPEGSCGGRVLRVPGRTASSSLRECGKISTFWEVLPQQPVGCFHSTPRCQGIAGRQKKISGPCVDAELSVVVAILSSRGPGQGSAQAAQEGCRSSASRSHPRTASGHHVRSQCGPF